MTATNSTSATAAATATATASPQIGPKSSTSPTTIPSNKKTNKKEAAAAAVDGPNSSDASQASIVASNSDASGDIIVDRNTTTGVQRATADIILEDTHNTTMITTTAEARDHIHVGMSKGGDRSDTTVLHAAGELSSRSVSQSPKEGSHPLSSATTIAATTTTSTAIAEEDDERKVMRMQMEQLLRDGDVSSRKGQYVESCLAFEGCLQLFHTLDEEEEEEEEDSMLLARIHNGLAMAYYNLGKEGSR